MRSLPLPLTTVQLRKSICSTRIATISPARHPVAYISSMMALFLGVAAAAISLLMLLSGTTIGSGPLYRRPRMNPGGHGVHYAAKIEKIEERPEPTQKAAGTL